MDKQSLLAAVTTIVAQQMNRAIEDCPPGADIEEELGGDPLDILEIGLAVEHKFGVDLRDEDYAGGFKTIDDLVGILRQLSLGEAA